MCLLGAWNATMQEKNEPKMSPKFLQRTPHIQTIRYSCTSYVTHAVFQAVLWGCQASNHMVSKAFWFWVSSSQYCFLKALSNKREAVWDAAHDLVCNLFVPMSPSVCGHYEVCECECVRYWGFGLIWGAGGEAVIVSLRNCSSPNCTHRLHTQL